MLRKILLIVFIISVVCGLFLLLNNDDKKANSIIDDEVILSTKRYNDHTKAYIDIVNTYNWDDLNSSFKDFSVKINSHFVAAKSDFSIVEAKLTEIKQLNLSKKYDTYIKLYELAVDHERSVYELTGESLNKLNPALDILDGYCEDVTKIENLDWSNDSYDDLKTWIKEIKEVMHARLARVKELRDQGIVTDELVAMAENACSICENIDDLLDALVSNNYENIQTSIIALSDAHYSMNLYTKHAFLVYLEKTFNELGEQIEKEGLEVLDDYKLSKEYFDSYIYIE